MSVTSAARLGPVGFGGAPLGNLYRAVDDAEAAAAVAAAWESGIRYYDTAPHYGLGLSEKRLGTALRDRPRDEFTISTKVGRVLDPNPAFDGGDDLADAYAVPNDLVRRFDPSESGIRRSIEESLERLGLASVDIAYLHDPDVYDLDRGLAEGLPALQRLRDEGVVGAIGVGTNDADAAVRAVREGDIDLVMIAGRYTVLEQPALAELLPLCLERGVGVVAAAPYNSGLLASDEPDANAHYDYARVGDDVLERARRIAAICREHGVALPVVAMQYPLRHPAVRTVVVGSARADAMRENVERATSPVPGALWDALRDEGFAP